MGRAASAGFEFDPPEWNYGVRPQGCIIKKTIRLHTAHGRLKLGFLQIGCDCLEAELIREEGTSSSPAEFRLTMRTGRYEGKTKHHVFISLNEPPGVLLKYTVTGWVMRRDLPAEIEVFFPQEEAAGKALLAWWNACVPTADHVKLLPIEEGKNYARLRELEQRTGAPPSEISAFVGGEIALIGEAEVRAGISGFLNLERDGEFDAERAPPLQPTIPREVTTPRQKHRALEVWLVHFSDCKACQGALEAARKLAQEYPEDVHLTISDIAKEPEALLRLFEKLKAHGITSGAIPSVVAFVGDEVLLGADSVETKLSDTALRILSRDSISPRAGKPANTPEHSSLPALELLPVLLAALADGVNPCAFAAMVVLISVLSVGGTPSRSRVFLGGLAFCLGVFTTYYTAGLLLLGGLGSLASFPTAERIVFWIVWVLAAVGAVLSLADAILYFRTGDPSNMRLKVPEAVRRTFAPILRRRFGNWGLAVGGFVGGAIIAIFEGVCTGQMYLPTIQYMTHTAGLRVKGAAYLFLYNLIFMLPLLAILGAAFTGVHFQRLNAFLRAHMGGLKLFLAAVFAALAVAMLTTN